MSAVPNWTFEETFLLSKGERLRILAINTDIDDEPAERGIKAVFTVEPIE